MGMLEHLNRGESLVSRRRPRPRISLNALRFVEKALKDVVKAVTGLLSPVELLPRLLGHPDVLIRLARHGNGYVGLLFKLWGLIDSGNSVHLVNRVYRGNFISLGYGGVH